MRILWVKAGRILPVDTGGRIRSYHLARQLARRHALTFLSYYDGDPDPAYERELSEHFPGAVAIRTGAPSGGLVPQGLHYARRLLQPAPYAVSKFFHPEVRRRIVSWDVQGAFDVMVCDFLSASLNFPPDLTTPTVLFQHNVESALWERQATHERRPLHRLVFANESRRMTPYERATVRRFDHIVAVSEHDRTQFTAMTDASRITVVPTGVDLSQFRSIAATTAREPVVTFLGSMDWEANADGVQWFCAETWPRVMARVPHARFRIVGRNPNGAIQQLASASVDVLGRVESVLPTLAETSVFVVPLRIGGGTRLKIYEAMAAGRAVVSTPVGAEGLSVTDGVDILLADTPAALADAVSTLLVDHARRDALGAAAAATAARYDWGAVLDAFEHGLALARNGAR